MKRTTRFFEGYRHIPLFIFSLVVLFSLSSSVFAYTYFEGIVNVPATSTIVGKSTGNAMASILFGNASSSPATLSSVSEIQVYIQKIGTPTDALRLYLSNDAYSTPGFAGYNQVSSAVSGASVSSSGGYVTFYFDPPIDLTWNHSFPTSFLLKRSGSYSLTDYYRMGRNAEFASPYYDKTQSCIDFIGAPVCTMDSGTNSFPMISVSSASTSAMQVSYPNFEIYLGITLFLFTMCFTIWLMRRR